MLRKILAVLAGLIAWAVIATLLNFGLRAALPGYTAAEPAMTFTLPMLCARLLLAACASLGAGVLAARLAAASGWTAPVLGVLLLLLFLPVHYGLWNRFPIWYHLLFLGTLVPLVMTGAHAGRR